MTIAGIWSTRYTFEKEAIFQDVAFCYMQQTNSLLISQSKFQMNNFFSLHYLLFTKEFFALLNCCLFRIVDFLSTVSLPNAYAYSSNIIRFHFIMPWFISIYLYSLKAQRCALYTHMH